ncbi:hypothetical protein C8A05DRAFT_16266 [Staphylotrichum tortipilum]|uniref:Carbohydrate-binding module family 18 protein n=1 Tax=Staphylotrichum tortipilum TaxID=2831512 RepID=A0AAN6MJ40_9PEZI|nr:hypothetical protein C8A05DRAFT_16266 [Staphylotrichum longicolle]
MDAAKITFLLGLFLATQGVFGLPAACSKTVAARTGDTCASISISAGINVADFLRNNPSINQCDKLSVGSQYCIDSGTSQAEVSPDGQCGGNFTCVGSPYGQCCSAHGWCGSTDDHCGPDCDAAHGICSVPAISSPLPPTSQPPTSCPAAGTVRSTILVTETVRKTVTDTTLVSSTSTILFTSVTTSVETVQKIVTVLFRTTSTIFETSTNTVTRYLTSTPPPNFQTVTYTVTVVSVRTVPTTITTTTTVPGPTVTVTETEDGWDPDPTWTRGWGTWTRCRTWSRGRGWNGEAVTVEVSANAWGK